VLAAVAIRLLSPNRFRRCLAPHKAKVRFTERIAPTDPHEEICERRRAAAISADYLDE
jgi:hypothetical protein